MAVGVDDAGNRGPAVEIDDARAGADRMIDVAAVAERHDTAGMGRQTGDDPVVTIQCVEASVDEREIGVWHGGDRFGAITV